MYINKTMEQIRYKQFVVNAKEFLFMLSYEEIRIKCDRRSLSDEQFLKDLNDLKKALYDDLSYEKFIKTYVRIVDKLLSSH